MYNESKKRFSVSCIQSMLSYTSWSLSSTRSCSTYRRPAAKIQFQSLVTEGNSWLYEFSQRHVSMSVSSTCCVLFFLSQVQCHCPRESSGRCSSHASLSFWRVLANMYRDSCYVIIGTWIFFSTCRPLSLTNWTIVSGY